jgi:hypothetical protein
LQEDTGLPENFARLLATSFDPELLRCGEAIREIANYDIPEPYPAPFLRFHSFITAPQPGYISVWRSDEKLERNWYHGHVNGILGNVRGALAAAHYHKANLAALEDAVTNALAASDYADRLGNSTMGLGGTRKLDFEYQAFVLACRRALDYLAGALADYFKTESNNFRSLPKSLAKKTPSDVVEAIRAAHARHVGDLDYIMAEGRKSVRNRIAHYEFVAAGVINLSRRGFVLFGGGEELGMPQGATEARLQDVLSGRLERLHACVADMIDSFVDAARRADQR